MTGFGRGRAVRDGYTVQADLRSLNGRFLEVRVRGLSEYPLLAQQCEDRLRAAFRRGTLELHVRLEEERPRRLALEAARAYFEDLSRLREELGLPEGPTLDHLLAVGVFEEAAPDEEALWPALEEALAGAVGEVAAARLREGEALRDALHRELAALEQALADAERLAPEALADARARIEGRLSELGVEADPARIAAELVLWAERSDVREELDRLRAHLRRFRDLLDADEPVGRELEFLAQEVGREAGTLAAKARSAALSQVALALRLGVERIREQARNVE
ncbi:MAG: YicC family protein [Candidatus Bipolaricaulota bacterium]|nr:YicC family protein [Candidatus Bipolaricaulota bacterium]